MSFGTRRSDEGCTEPGALVMAGLVIAGLGTWVVGVGATVLVVTLLEAVGVCNVGAVEGAVAPAQLAKINMSAVAPARDIAAYRRARLTWTNSNEPTKAVALKCHTRLRALVVVHAEAEAVVPLQWAGRLFCPLLRGGGRCRSAQRATSGNQGAEGDEAIACGAKS